MTFLLLLSVAVLAVSSNLLAVSSEQLHIARSLVQFALASPPLGAVLPNSDPSCDPLWAYRTGCYSDYTCTQGPVCTCKDGTRCTDSSSYFGIFMCPCAGAPQLPEPLPTPEPPPPPQSNCVQTPPPRCQPAYSQTDATQRCNALGGTLQSMTSRKYGCTCCIGSGSIIPSPPPGALSGLPPAPPPKHIEDFGASIRRRVGIIVGCSIGGACLLSLLIWACVCCISKRRRASASMKNGLEGPPASAQSGSRAPSEHHWFEPGHSGAGFKTTQDGVFLFGGKSGRFEEHFAEQDAKLSHVAEVDGRDNPRTKRRSGEDQAPPATSTPDRGNGKEPQLAGIEGLPEDEICIVCCSAPKECVFVPCGHHATCLACGSLCQQQAGKGCPVCRGPIERVLKIYEA